jgi:hypothetical protein
MVTTFPHFPVHLSIPMTNAIVVRQFAPEIRSFTQKNFLKAICHVIYSLDIGRFILAGYFTQTK